MNQTDKFEHPEDGIYQIQPLGKFPNARAQAVQIIDAQSRDSIVSDFNAKAAEPGFTGMLIDHEHFQHDESKETIAYGWLMALEGRADGIYGQIRWTGTGQQAVDSGDYRFFSCEFDPADLVTLNPGKSPRQVRPMKLDGLTLTNAPNCKGGKPITNRRVLNRNTTVNQNPMDTTLDPKTASAELKRLAQAHAGQTGMAFSDSWNIVRDSHPELATAITNRVPAKFEPPDPVQEKFSVEREEKIKEVQRQNPGWNFERCYNSVRNRHPGLFGLTDDAPASGVTPDQIEAAVTDYCAKNRKVSREYAMRLLRARPDVFGFEPGDIQAIDSASDTVQNRALREQEGEREEVMNRIGQAYPNFNHSQRWDMARRQRPELFGIPRKL